MSIYSIAKYLVSVVGSSPPSLSYTFGLVAIKYRLRSHLRIHGIYRVLFTSRSLGYKQRISPQSDGVGNRVIVIVFVCKWREGVSL